ncbi:MAG: hypothetical protein E7363_05485 [Clostridiales bacterium]|nr:hypothetical protein [Clostridiales bacterium]
MNFTDFYKNNVVLLDGGFGTLLQSYGLGAGEKPERWNITHAEDVIKGHKAYYDAGSNVVSTNTFGANLLNFTRKELEEIIPAAVQNAKMAREQSVGTQPKFIALDIGPSGRLVGPFGGFSFEDAVATFSETVKLGVAAGVDLIIIETMNDGYEAKAALIAAKENSDSPVFVSNAYGTGGRLMTGASPTVMATIASGMGASAVGANCSFGPKQLRPVMEELLTVSSLPIILKPNAGLPQNRNGVTTYDVTPEEFAEDVSALLEKGVRIVGGCCGTTPSHISALAKKMGDRTPVSTPMKNEEPTVAASFCNTLTLSKPLTVGGALNTATPKGLAIFEGMDEYEVLDEALSMQEEGIDLLLFAPDTANPDMEFIRAAVYELNAVIKAPLMLLSENAEMIETVLRAYNGKAVLIFPQTEGAQKAAISAAKKYGAVIVGKVDGITDSVSTEFQSLFGQGFSKADILSELYVENILI